MFAGIDIASVRHVLARLDDAGTAIGKPITITEERAAPMPAAPPPASTQVRARACAFRVQVPEDCVGDQDEVARRQNLKDVERRYADIIDADTAIAAIERWSRANDRG